MAIDNGVQEKGYGNRFILTKSFIVPLDFWVTFDPNDLPLLISLKMFPNS